MKKRLLLAFMAICASVSGFALEQGDFVYTPQGRFQITGANLNANNAFQTMDGWTAIGEGKTLADLFITNADALSSGFNSVSSTAATAGEGMYFQFVPTDASATYVVSFKMKGAPLNFVQTFINGDNTATVDKDANLVKVAGNDANTYTYPSTEGEVIVNTAEELTENWQTFNYAIQGDGTARTWFISFTKMATTIEIADLQIAPALQFADLRQRDAMLEKLNAYKNCYNWSEDLLNDFAVNEFIANLEGIGAESGQAELDELLATAQEVLDEFVKANMDDYLAGNADNYLGIYNGEKNIQKVSNYGDWTATTTGRAFWSVGDYPDLGHYGGNNSWNYNNPDEPMGVYLQKKLDTGSYVFSIEAKAGLRVEATSNSWTVNEGWDPAYGVAYIGKVETVKDENGNDVIAVTDTIVSQVKDLESLNFTPFLITAVIEKGGNYEIGFKAYCKDAYKDLKNGSVTYVKDASIWGKNDNKYNQKQLGYEADVLEQIAAGRTNITTANEYLANTDYYWGSAELEACVDTVETKIAAYEAMDQDAIIATYQEDYVKSTSEETGYMVYEVYQQAVKDIIAANKRFLALNDTLASIQTAIDNAESVMAMRLYDAATGKNDLLKAISSARNLQNMMKSVQYSEENAAAIVAENAALAEAVEVFKASVPASAKTTLVDIDFENDAVLNENTGFYNVAGAAGSMEFSSWSLDGTGDQPFEKGYWSNGEQLWKGYIRIGNGTGTVVFDPTENGSMGTNILQVTCDLYLQGLSGRSLGFYLKNVVEGEDGPEDAEIFGLFHNFYNNTNTTNTCNVDINKMWFKSGSGYNNASPADADEETLTANPLQKSHVEVIMDYGKKAMYCTVSSPNGSDTSEEVALEAVPTKFILQSNYNNNDRRPWFDNLKIERITAGEYVPEDPGLPVADGTYFLQNVATKKFFAAGHSWGTQAIVNNDGLDVVFAATPEGKYQLDAQIKRDDTNHFVGSNLYVDSPAYDWSIAKVADDIITLANDTAFVAVDENDNLVLVKKATEAAQWKIVTYEDRILALEGATEATPANATFAIKDANFGRCDTRSSFWTMEASNQNLSGGNNENNCAESWHSTFSLTQTIEGLPNGVYELTAQGFFRQDGEDTENLPYFFINDKKATFPALTGTENSMSDASVSFTSGLYTIDPIKVVVTDGTITVGAKNEANLTIWCIWDNFQLKYYGPATEPEGDPNNLVKNWDCSGSDVSSFWVHEWRTMDAQTDGPANLVDGAAKVYVRSFAQAAAAGNATLKDGNKENVTLDNFADWDSQFFITWDEAKATAAGDKLQLKMKVKADKAQAIASQLHKAPGAYVHWYAVGDINVTTEWADFVSAEVDVVAGNDPGYGKTAEGCWTIAFNLAKGEENTLYFDDMVVYVIKPTGITEMYRINPESGVRYNLSGKRVDDSYKGIVIMNGKKMLQK